MHPANDNQTNKYDFQTFSVLSDLGVAPGHPLEIVVEVGGIFEAEGISNVGHAPVGVLQKGFCFGGYTLCDMHRCRLAGNFLTDRLR